jgi:hypothetical protein
MMGIVRVDLMKIKLTCLSLSVFLFSSCDKSGTAGKPESTSSNKPQIENRAEAPTTAEKPAAVANPRITNDPPLSHPVTVEMIRAAGTTADDGSWESLTAEQRIEKFKSSGIAHLPKYVSDKILGDATKADNPEDQVNFIYQQAAAWHHINEFKESINDIPDHMKVTLLERLSKKHGASWKDVTTELDEQVAASVRVMELRLNGIPGMSPDESQDLIISALEKHGPDYKTILTIADQSAKK